MTPTDRIKILIVEDEPILAMELSDSLEEEGYDVVGIVNNGRKALELFRRQTVDLLLCDITIKGDWDGIQTVEQLVAERPVPVIYLTAHLDRETLDRAKQTYPAAYVNKPYQLHSLRIAIELAIYNFSAQQSPKQTEHPAIPATERDVLGRETILLANNHLFIKQNYQFVKIDLDDILYLEADNIYTTLVTKARKYALRLTLSGLLERISKPELIRIHRSYAINVEKVESFNESEVSIGPHLIPLSRGYKEDFLRHFLQR